MAKLVKEIREEFASNEDMAMEGIARLEYLHACLEESLRMYPPVPIGLPRIVPAGGATICGTYIPAGVSPRYLNYLAECGVINHS
jgi:cytochrome P450